MKNEIGRKLTSLTIMAIMFAGGMAIGVPSFMPSAQSDFSVTDGMLTASSEFIQGGAILELVVNDPSVSVTDDDIANGPEVYIQGLDHIMNQAINGKWYLYIVDDSVATELTDDAATGLEYGIQCTTGIGVGKTADIIADDTSGVYDIFAEGVATSGETADSGGGCLNLDGSIGTSDATVGASTERSKLTDAVLKAAPTLSDHNGSANDLGQRGHALNSSGYGSWPYLLAIDFSDDEVIEYGDDSVNVEFGNTDDEISINLANRSPAGSTALHLSFTDPALNIDPTSADIWIFDLDATAADSSVIFANNGSNTALSPAILGDMGCIDNCRLSSDATTGIAGTEYDSVTMTESGMNTGVFESFTVNGTSEINTAFGATGDSKIVFDYNGETVDMIITYNDATIDFDAGGDWGPASAVTVTINDPDMNHNPLDQDTLDVGNEQDIIPTIVMGDPLSITDGGTNSNMARASGDAGAGVHFGGDDDRGADEYDLQIYNTTDTSERLRIIMTGVSGDASNETTTWYNFTTGHTRTQLVNLPGTVVLSYDISGITAITGSTDIDVFVTDDGSNVTDSEHTAIECTITGNTDVGVCSLHGETDGDANGALFPREVGTTSWGGVDNAGTSFVTVNFKVTHASGSTLSSDSDFAVAIDFCNFDQNNGSDVHNCVYRIEAEETGDDTGIFTGTVEYINLNNSTSNGTTSGETNGNDFNVHTLLTDVNSTQDVIVVLMDGTDSSDAVRVTYNDTDSIQAGDVIGAQIDTSTHSGTVELDADTYEADDIATITVVDADLNMDSGIRDTYQNSSTTFVVTVTGSDGAADASKIATAPMTLIETDVDSGVFMATFTVPDYNGQDLEVTYYESKNAGGNTVELYDTATVSSNSGSVSFDKSVYPVPFDSGDLEKGDNSNDLAVDGNVTLTVTVSDADFTDSTLTTGTTDAAGTIVIKLVEGSTSYSCYTAGSQVATASTSTAVDELGPLAEVVKDSSEYEIEFTLDKVHHCGTSMATVSSGDIIQVKYVDASDDSGSSVSVYDSSTFDLRTGSLSVDKDVYVLGSDMVVTLTDPDLNLDGGSTETYDMDIIEWDSDASSSELLGDTEDFFSNPSSIEETGDDTGVFQSVVTLPSASIKAGDGADATGTTIDFGEAVTLTYADQSLSGENQVGDDDLDVETYFSISNFGALIELDQAVYTWTDVVYFTITAPDHNTNTASEESIGTAALPIQITTRAGKLCTTGDKTYFADESGPDTGVFEGEVQLLGFSHTIASSQAFDSTGDQSCGSTNDGGSIKTAGQTDGISVSYEYNDAQVVVASASIIWNIGETSFDSSAVSAGGSSVVTVVDPDENTDDDIIDTFTVDVFSDSDAGGFQLTMNETDEDTGVFEGEVFFSSEIATSGTTLRVSEGDTVTAEFVDETLPEPYTSDDDLTIAATTTVGTAFPPLERAPAANARVVDAFGASVAEVSVDQQVQIAADVSNGQSGDQAFAYLVQVQDGDGVTVSLAWITGSLTAGQSMSPALSWTPDASGSYTATVFVWESVDNPTALSPTVSVSIDVV